MIDFARNVQNIKDSMGVSIAEMLLTAFRNNDYRDKFTESRNLILAHSLEKGMGLANTRKGYGQKNAIKLVDSLNIFYKKNPDSLQFSFIESMGILKRYIEYQENDGVNYQEIKDKFMVIYESLSVEQLEKISRYSYGYNIVRKDDFIDKIREMDFEEFVSTRRSLRTFSEKEIDKKSIYKAIHIANYAPSACNRQPINIYCALGNENARKVNQYLSGNKSFTDNVNNFAIITADRACFAGDEQYQWYINGGIYLGYFVEALHSLGIGSCIMQWFAFSKNEKKIKELLSISKTEAIIAVVCMGYYPDSYKCICAQRQEPDEMVNFLE